MDGTCDIDIQEEDNINIFKVDQSVHDDIRDKLEDDQQLRERIQLRDSAKAKSGVVDWGFSAWEQEAWASTH